MRRRCQPVGTTRFCAIAKATASSSRSTPTPSTSGFSSKLSSAAIIRDSVPPTLRSASPRRRGRLVRWACRGPACRCTLKRSTAAERIVALVFPIAALVIVRYFHRDHIFRVFESEFCRHPDLHQKTIGARQDFVREFKRHLGLRMQRGRHVERRVVAFLVGALEPAIFGAGV